MEDIFIVISVIALVSALSSVICRHLEEETRMRSNPAHRPYTFHHSSPVIVRTIPPTPVPKPIDYDEVSGFVVKILASPIDRTAAAVLRDYPEDARHKLAPLYAKRYARWVKWDAVRSEEPSSKDRRRIMMADIRFKNWVRQNFRKYL